MPNGDVSGGGFPVVDILEGPEVPGTGIPTGPVGTFIESVVSFFGGLFGGGPPAFEKGPIAELAAVARAGGPTILESLGIVPLGTGRPTIATPAEGGPPLVTERFADLPGPFVSEPDIPVLQELGIPFPEPLPIVLPFIPFRPGPIPEPDVLEEDMPVDVPLLTSSFLPALRQATTPAVTGFLGGLAQDVVSGLFARPLGELGLGQVPMAQPTAAVARPGVCPPEKPSTRILRFIKANTGVSINLSRAKSLIRELGLENAARCLGITAQEVCQLLIVASPRRRRGISASDIRIVKRTARRFENLKHALGHLGGRAGPHHHRRRHTARHK